MRFFAKFPIAARVPAAVLLLAAGLLLAAPPAARAEDSVASEPTALGLQLLERFEVRDLADGLLLQPRVETSAVRVIEISDDGEILVNGKSFDERELAGFLGRDGELVAELLALDADARFAAFGHSRQARAPRVERRVSRRGKVTVEAPIVVPGARVRLESSGDDRVSIGRSIHVRTGESVKEAVCIGCGVTIDGRTASNAVAIGGSVRVGKEGRVGGEAVAVGGSVRVEDGGQIDGDAVAVGGTVETRGEGVIGGQRTSVGLGGPWFDGWSWGFPWGAFSDFGRLLTAILRTGVLALLAVLTLLLARPAVDTASRRASAEPWKAAFAGLLAQLLFLPVLVLVVVVLAVSIIGIPLLVLVPFACLALVIATFVGYVGVAQILGRGIERRFGAAFGPLLAVVVGVVAIQAISLLGRLVSLPGGWLAIAGFSLVGLGFFLKYIAWTVGLGAMTLAAFGGDWRRATPVSVAAPPAAPEPEPEGPADEERPSI
jgi:hypothetical protein